ncbi:hypothetical protein Tdes44962_MAKER10067, partial [Teratosphaeria destructans]
TETHAGPQRNTVPAGQPAKLHVRFAGDPRSSGPGSAPRGLAGEAGDGGYIEDAGPSPRPPAVPRPPPRALHKDIAAPRSPPRTASPTPGRDGDSEHIEDVTRHDPHLQPARIRSHPPVQDSSSTTATPRSTSEPRLPPGFRAFRPRLPRIRGPLRSENTFLNGKIPIPASQVRRARDAEKLSLRGAERKRRSSREPDGPPPDKRGRPQDGHESADEEIPRGRSLPRHWDDIRHAREGTPAPEGRLASAPHDLAQDLDDPDLRTPVIAPDGTVEQDQDWMIATTYVKTEDLREAIPRYRIEGRALTRPSFHGNFLGCFDRGTLSSFNVRRKGGNANDGREERGRTYRPIGHALDMMLGRWMGDACVSGSWLTETWGNLPGVVVPGHSRRNALSWMWSCDPSTSPRRWRRHRIERTDGVLVGSHPSSSLRPLDSKQYNWRDRQDLKRPGGPLDVPKKPAKQHRRSTTPLTIVKGVVTAVLDAHDDGEEEDEDEAHVYRAPEGWTCPVCGDDEDDTGQALMLCYMCGRAGYCSRRCMRSDRARHAPQCKRPVPPHFDASKITKDPKAQCDNCCDVRSKDDLPGLVLCSRCGRAQYCSVQCQEEHYREHQNAPCTRPETTDVEHRETGGAADRTSYDSADEGPGDQTPWYRIPDGLAGWYRCSHCTSATQHRDGGGLSLCRTCGNAQYCSRRYQRAHHAKHVPRCRPPKAPKFDTSKRSEDLDAKCNNCLAGREKVVDHGPLVLCPVCGKTKYCSSPCQESHYVEHQHLCYASAKHESSDDSDSEDGSQSDTSEGFYDEESQQDTILTYSIANEHWQCVSDPDSRYHGSVANLLVDNDVGDVRGFRPWQLRHVEYLVVFGEQSPPAWKSKIKGFWAANNELRAFVSIPGIGYGQRRGRTFRPHINAAKLIEGSRVLEFETRCVKFRDEDGSRRRGFEEIQRLGGDMGARWDDDLQRYWRTVRWAIQMYKRSLRPREYFGAPTPEYNPYAPRAGRAPAGGQTPAGDAETTAQRSSPRKDDSSEDKGNGHPARKARKRADSVADSGTSTSTSGPPIAICISKGRAISFAKPGPTAHPTSRSKSNRDQKKGKESLEELKARTERIEAEAEYYDEQLASSQLELGELQDRRVKEDLSGDAGRTSLQEQVQQLKAVRAGLAAEVQSCGAGNALTRQSRRVSADGWDLGQLEQALAASRADQGVKPANTQRDRCVATPLLPDPDEDDPFDEDDPPDEDDPAPAAVGRGQDEGKSRKPSEMSEEEQLRRAIEMSLQDLGLDEASSEADPAVATPDTRMDIDEMAPSRSGGPEEHTTPPMNEVVSPRKLLRLQIDGAADYEKDATDAPGVIAPMDAADGGDTDPSLSGEGGWRQSSQIGTPLESARNYGCRRDGESRDIIDPLSVPSGASAQT